MNVIMDVWYTHIYMATLLCTSTINSVTYLTAMQVNGKGTRCLSTSFPEDYLKSGETKHRQKDTSFYSKKKQTEI